MSDEISFEPLMNLIDSVALYSRAVQTGNSNFINFLPTYFKQTAGKIAQQRLDHSAANFKNAILVDIQDDLLVVTLDPKDWLANAVETGVDSFAMVDSHLKGPKTKTSKRGFKYKVIPMRVWTTSPSAKTDKGQELFEKVKQLLKKPKFGGQKQTALSNGALKVSQEVQTDDSDLKGMYRVREYESQSAFLEGKKPTQSQYVLFRTISSEHPEKFVHPGIKPGNILKDAKTTLENEMEPKWNQMIDSELQKKGFK
jgi:hypothetical protein